MQNFWQNLKKPFFILAPMDDVTDVVFRTMVNKISPPDVFFTEFTNVEGLQSPGRERLLPRLWFEKDQQPIVAQIWGQRPENYYQTAQELKKMGFSGIDINMGCPDKKVIKQGSCSALINNPKLAREIIIATQEGAGGLPVSVKTRLGLKNIQTEEWIGFLLSLNVEVLTIHGRTAKEMSAVPAHWEEIAKVVKMRNEMKSKTLIVGNGDVADYRDGLKKVEETEVDGIMIGRGIFHNLWAFAQNPEEFQDLRNSSKYMLTLLLDHARLFDKTWGKGKNFAILRKFFKIYVSGLPEAAQLRERLYQTENLAQVEEAVAEYLKNLSNTEPRVSLDTLPPAHI